MADGETGRPLVRRRAAGSVAEGASRAGRHGSRKFDERRPCRQHRLAAGVVRGRTPGADLVGQAGVLRHDAPLTLAFSWPDAADCRAIHTGLRIRTHAERAFDVDMGESPLTADPHRTSDPWHAS